MKQENVPRKFSSDIPQPHYVKRLSMHAGAAATKERTHRTLNVLLHCPNRAAELNRQGIPDIQWE
jgi:hypothetical protein